MFKPKKYIVEITYADNTATTHRNCTRIRNDAFRFTFIKDRGVYIINWDKVYGIAYREEK